MSGVMKVIVLAMSLVVLTTGTAVHAETTGLPGTQGVCDSSGTAQATPVVVAKPDGGVAQFSGYVVWYFTNGRWHGDGPYASYYDARTVLQRYIAAGYSTAYIGGVDG